MSARTRAVDGPTRPRAATATVLSGLMLLALAGALGKLAATDGLLALVFAFGVLTLGLVARDLSLIAMLSFPASLVMIRTGPLSVADLVLFAATCAALLVIRWDATGPLRPLLAIGITYLGFLVPTLLLNPYLANGIEWVHEAFMVLGSLVVGWVTGVKGRARAALTSYTIACSALAVAAVGTGLYMLATSQGFGPVYMPYLHKNFTGNALVFAFLIAWVRPDWLGWSRAFAHTTLVLTTMGIAATGSRQAILSAVAAILILAARHSLGRGLLVLSALTPVAWFTVASVLEQLASDNRFNSAWQRLAWYAESIDIWHQSPVFGVGLRWWYTGEYASFQPPNAYLEMLTSGGVIGLIGFMILMAGGIWAVSMIDPPFGNVALAIVIARFTQGHLDLYWVAGQSAFLWMVAGLVLGAKAHEEIEGSLCPPGTAPATDATNPAGAPS